MQPLALAVLPNIRMLGRFVGGMPKAYRLDLSSHLGVGLRHEGCQASRVAVASGTHVAAALHTIPGVPLRVVELSGPSRQPLPIPVFPDSNETHARCSTLLCCRCSLPIRPVYPRNAALVYQQRCAGPEPSGPFPPALPPILHALPSFISSFV